MHRNHDGYDGGSTTKKSPDVLLLADRLPPQNLEVERNVIGSMLFDNNVIDDLVLFLTPADFYRGSHATIYRAICDLRADGKPVDVDLLANELERLGKFREVGGDDEIAGMLDGVPHAANALHYGLIVRQKSIKRQYAAAANEILRSVYSNEATAEETAETAEREVFAVADQETQSELASSGELIDATLARMESRQQGEVTGIGSGIADLDEVTGGFRPGHSVYIAARTSVGKTALALNFAEHMAVNLRQPVLFISLEMSQDEIMDRLVVSRAKINGKRMQSGELTDIELTKARKTRNDIYAAPLFIDDSSSRSVLQIGAIARRLKLRRGLKFIIVDYIQLVDPDDPRDSRQVQIAKISRRLKKMSRELGVTVITLSQLNRGPENREDKKPRVADMRESGDQEQDADLVLLLHRPALYDETKDPGIAIIIVGKNRHGERKDVPVAFISESMRFGDLAAHAGSPPIADFGQPAAF